MTLPDRSAHPLSIMRLVAPQGRSASVTVNDRRTRFGMLIDLIKIKL